MNVLFGSKNETHFGAMRFELFQQLDRIRVNYQCLIPDSPQVLVDHTINFCRLQRERGSHILIKYFIDINVKIFNLDLIKCPMKKGSYELMKARLIDVGDRFEIPSYFPSTLSFMFL